jgi:hypothetical protein
MDGNPVARQTVKTADATVKTTGLQRYCTGQARCDWL